ncbi:hypothetical protein ACFWOT_08495 [Streptomyces sp. NPDC058440]|uniref:hypothetical protein n=1 Tax=Streptomyces sp. NPDC058440 TaxID=3346501 RepID=UPI003648D951
MASGDEEAREATRVEYHTPERKRALIFSPLLLAWGIVSLVRVRLGHISGFDILGLTMGALVPSLLNISFGKTVLDDTGIHAWRPLWRRTIRWQNVRSIATEEKSSRGHGARRIRVRRHKGGAVWLPAPYVGIRTSKEEADRFAAQVAEITARWQAHTSAGGA